MRPFKKKPIKRISRNKLKILIFEKFGLYSHDPLDMKYILVPDEVWLRKNTPPPGDFVRNINDCNHVACRAMAKMQTHCVGMVRVEWGNGVDHTLNIVVFESGELMLWDAHLMKLFPVENRMVRDMRI